MLLRGKTAVHFMEAAHLLPAVYRNLAVWVGRQDRCMASQHSLCCCRFPTEQAASHVSTRKLHNRTTLEPVLMRREELPLFGARSPGAWSLADHPQPRQLRLHIY